MKLEKKSFINFILEVRWFSYLVICVCIQVFCFFSLPYFSFIDSFIHSFIHLFVRFISTVRESSEKLFLTISMTYIKKYNVSIGVASSILSIRNFSNFMTNINILLYTYIYLLLLIHKIEFVLLWSWNALNESCTHTHAHTLTYIEQK